MCRKNKKKWHNLPLSCYVWWGWVGRPCGAGCLGSSPTECRRTQQNRMRPAGNPTPEGKQKTKKQNRLIATKGESVNAYLSFSFFQMDLCENATCPLTSEGKQQPFHFHTTIQGLSWFSNGSRRISTGVKFLATLPCSKIGLKFASMSFTCSTRSTSLPKTWRSG